MAPSWIQRMGMALNEGITHACLAFEGICGVGCPGLAMLCPVLKVET